MKILAIDIGGTHFKFRTQAQRTAVKVDSGPEATPADLMEAIAAHTAGWGV